MNPLLNIGSILFLIGGAADAIIGAATPFGHQDAAAAARRIPHGS